MSIIAPTNVREDVGVVLRMSIICHESFYDGLSTSFFCADMVEMFSCNDVKICPESFDPY